MKLSISNIAWSAAEDETYYKILQKKGVLGLEIAPTKLFGKAPYEKTDEAKEWSKWLKYKYNLEVSSMQSIWFGRQERLFVDSEDRNILLAYTKNAIEFAESINCHNIVFGCPKNRNRDGINVNEIAMEFFGVIGDYAYEHNTVIAMEANPTIYGTDYINTTTEAIKLVKMVGSKGFKVNLDFGTIIENQEGLSEIEGFVDIINHVHISEPHLAVIKQRDEHLELKKILEKDLYANYISIEMKDSGRKEDILGTIQYVKGVFG